MLGAVSGDMWDATLFNVCFGWLNRWGGGGWVIRGNFGVIISVIGLNFDKGEWVIRCNRCNSLCNLSVIYDLCSNLLYLWLQIYQFIPPDSHCITSCNNESKRHK